jgi:hypothetical protein
MVKGLQSVVVGSKKGGQYTLERREVNVRGSYGPATGQTGQRGGIMAATWAVLAESKWKQQKRF